MTLPKEEIRNREAKWLIQAMNRSGLSNADLHERLGRAGFEGGENNVTMWKTARTAIPHEWLIEVIKSVSEGDPESTIIAMYSRRFPYLRPYFKECALDEILNSERDKGREERTPREISFYPKRGNKKGEKHVPHKNRNGKYQGGVSRFSKDIEEFDSLADLWAQLQSNPDFKVRMSPEDRSGPPSLIKRDSLVLDW